jgi:hypothetical protein
VDAESRLVCESGNQSVSEEETKTTLFKKADEETNLCVLVDAIGLVVALEVA